MLLTRLATIELNRPAPSRLGRWTLQASNQVAVTVSMIQGAEDITTAPAPQPAGLSFAWPYERTSARLAVAATVPAGAVQVDSDHLAAIPDQPRLMAEAAILEYADLLGVTYQCRRVVRSPKPCVALSGEDDQERDTLKAATGLRAPLRSRPRAVLLPEMLAGSSIGVTVVDRLDGLALLADALSEDGPVGQVHDLFRVLERAFATGPVSCIDPLLALLQAGPVDLGWSRDEIADWFLRLRPEVTHADRRPVYARAADVAPHLGRIEYAAYDVLFNKETWRTTDGARRNAILLGAGIERDGDTMRIQRPDVTIVMPWIDPFGVFPIDFDFTVQASGEALTAMPGYTADEDGTYIARARVRNALTPQSEVYECEILTKHGPPLAAHPRSSD